MRFNSECIAECRGAAQTNYRLVIQRNVTSTLMLSRPNTNSYVQVVFDSGVVTSSNLFHKVLANLQSDSMYTGTVSIWSNKINTTTTTTTTKTTTTRAAADTINLPTSFNLSFHFHTALRNSDWQGSWIGGGTQLRTSFELPSESSVESATAYASGVGCFVMTVNGLKVDNSSFMDPGWSNLPSFRMMYRAFDVTALLHQGSTNALGVRLGFCKYGYQDAFCSLGASGSNAICRGFLLQLNIKFTDGTSVNVTSDLSGAWQATTTANPIVYDHLYHGEIRDDRVGDVDWDQPRFTTASNDDSPAKPFANTHELSSLLTLLPMAPIAVTNTTTPVTITRISKQTLPLCAGDFLAAVVKDGESGTLTCGDRGLIKGVTFASYGNPTFASHGRFIAGTVNGKCADPNFVSGCIFWEDASKNKHFVEQCVTTPCGVNACDNPTNVGVLVKSLPTAANFTCADVEPQCASDATKAKCDAENTTSIVAAACVGKNTCTLTANAAVYGDVCHGTGDPRTLMVVAYGCAQAPRPTNDVFVFDFGVNQVGFATLNITGPAGATVVLKYAEVLKLDGTVDMAWCAGEGSACDCSGINCANQTDRFTLRGEGDGDSDGEDGDGDGDGNGDGEGETYTPTFTYHGFRYVQLEGWPLETPPTKETLTALFVHSALEDKGSVHFKLDILNRIQTAYMMTQLSNMHSHPTDCPTREKRGWTGDSQLTSGGASMNFDTAAFYSNWLDVMSDHQAVNCASANTSPKFPQSNVDVCCDPPNNGFGCDYTGLPSHRFTNTSGALADVIPFMHVGGWPGDPTWMVAGATINWEVAVRDGDIAFAQQHYETSRALIEFMSRNVDPEVGLIQWGYYGDWLALENIPKPQVTSFAHILGVSRLRDLANMTSHTADTIRYSTYLNKLKSIYHKTYFDNATQCYNGGSQTAQILPLYLSITPPDNIDSVVACLVKSLNTHANTTTSGIVGTAFLLQVLQAHAPTLALTIATATTAPSWGHMVNVGPGTIWESWTDSTNSHNHPALGATISQYLYTLAGISLDNVDVWMGEPMKVGPNAAVAFDLGAAECRVNTSVGPLWTKWSTEVDTQIFEITAAIPHGMRASIQVAKPHDCDVFDIVETISKRNIASSSQTPASTSSSSSAHSSSSSLSSSSSSSPSSSSSSLASSSTLVNATTKQALGLVDITTNRDPRTNYTTIGVVVDGGVYALRLTCS